MNIFKNMINKEDEGNEEDTKKEPEWTMFRSFFFALHGSTELDFQNSNMFGVESFMQASFKNFDFKVRELKIYKGTGSEQHEMESEEDIYNARIQ